MNLELVSANQIIGIDVGVKKVVTASDEINFEFEGKKYCCNQLDGINPFKENKHQLAKLQKDLARKTKYSRNWYQQKAKLSKMHKHIACIRHDFIHKISTAITGSYAYVAIENLNIKNMSKSSQGTKEQSGKPVKQKSGLNRSILDQGWGIFRQQLEYKLEWNGGMLLVVPPQYTSQTCPPCEHVSQDNRKTQSQFECVNCGYKNHADMVGAINILERGHRLLACGEPVKSNRSMKQEPAEVSQLAFS